MTLAPAHPAAMPRPGCARAARRVLVIEDEPDMAQLLCLHLAELPAVVQAIADGISGLQAAQQRGPWDLIVLDLRLPGLGGLDVCRALRQEGWDVHPIDVGIGSDDDVVVTQILHVVFDV